MRLLTLSLGCCAALALPVAAESGGSSGSSSIQIPFGQTSRDLHWPIYQNGQLAYTLAADTATGLSLNRAQTTNLIIQIYTQDKVTTTITSPNADLYVAERKMRTKNSVKVDRADLTATSQICDFDLITKKYVMRTRVHVILKHFDAGAGVVRKKDVPALAGPAGRPAAPASVAAPLPVSTPAPVEESQPAIADPRARASDNLLDMPGAYATTNNGPITPAPSKP
jgi:hypothetical protein